MALLLRLCRPLKNRLLALVQSIRLGQGPGVLTFWGQQGAILPTDYIGDAKLNSRAPQPWSWGTSPEPELVPRVT